MPTMPHQNNVWMKFLRLCNSLPVALDANPLYVDPGAQQHFSYLPATNRFLHAITRIIVAVDLIATGGNQE